MTIKMKKRDMGLIILGFLVAGFAAWWIVSAPRNKVITDTKAGFIFRNVTIGAPDASALGSFYRDVFGFEVLKDNGEWNFTGPDSKGILLKAPGYDADGPTFRIVSSSMQTRQGPLGVNDLGFAHICFEADDVRGTVKKIVAAGGSIISTFPDIEKEVCVYTKDPAGNIVEVHVPTPSSITPQAMVRFVGSVLRTKMKLNPSKDALIRFLHVNIVSRDWNQLKNFYQAVFGCTPFGARRDYNDEWIANVVGIRDVRVEGRHVAVPGYSLGGPTLEIFTYSKKAKQGPLDLMDRGIVSVGFDIGDIATTLRAIVNEGGTVVTSRGDGSAIVKDPDGNTIQMKRRTVN